MTAHTATLTTLAACALVAAALAVVNHRRAERLHADLHAARRRLADAERQNAGAQDEINDLADRLVEAYQRENAANRRAAELRRNLAAAGEQPRRTCRYTAVVIAAPIEPLATVTGDWIQN